MLIAIPALIIGWVAYAMWLRKIQEEEKNQPKPQSQRLVKTKTEISDWAQKMKEYKPPKIKRSYADDEPEEETEDKPEKTE
jgi:ABC-type glycerol-3-phosphate transport system substrate-binding protein